MTPSLSGQKRASYQHAPSTPSTHSPRCKRASRSSPKRSLFDAAASITSATCTCTCTAYASIALPRVIRRSGPSLSLVIDNVFEPAPPSIATMKISNLGLIPKSNLLKWFRPDSFRLDVIYSEDEIKKEIKHASTLLQYQFNQTGNNPNMGINVADAERNECDQRVGPVTRLSVDKLDD